MRLDHDFYLVRRAEHDFSDYAAFIKAPNAVHLHDDMVSYLWDTLRWIPTLNPAKSEPHQGLCRYGPTVIGAAGASTACSIFGGWADILACGPAELELTGSWSWVEGEPCASGQYETLRFHRDALVEVMRTLARYADQVQRSGDAFYLLHLGI